MFRNIFCGLDWRPCSYNMRRQDTTVKHATSSHRCKPGAQGEKGGKPGQEKKWTWKECVFDRAAVSSRIAENRLLKNGKENLRSLQTSPQATTLNLWGHGKYIQIHFNLRRCWPIVFKVNYHSVSDSDKSIFLKKAGSFKSVILCFDELGALLASC